jgi:RNA polymerase sigma-70 factor (ECF subfamily)
MGYATVSPGATPAQDLTQDIFLRVFRSLKSYRSAEGSFVTWLTSEP